ncbi:coiled-coil domain-containing protein [Thermofilum pendens]|nr:hypothetical protein [Thermofilum pendens]
MNGMHRKTLGLVLLLLLVASLAGVAPVVSAQQASTEQERLQRHISFLLNQTARLENFVNSRVSNATLKELLLQQISTARSTLQQALQTLQSGDVNGTKELVREASAELRSVALQLYKEIREREKLRAAHLLEVEIRVLQNQLRALRNVASRLGSLGADTSNVTRLIDEASSLLDQALNSLKQNNMAQASQLVEQARLKVKEAERSIWSLAVQLRSKRAEKDLELFANASRKVYERLLKVSPGLAAQFKNWSDARISEIKKLISEGKHVAALEEIRKSFHRMGWVVAGLAELGRVEALAREGERVASVIKVCNATLAGEISKVAAQLRDAASKRDLQKVRELSAQLRDLLVEARFACRPGHRKGKP